MLDIRQETQGQEDTPSATRTNEAAKSARHQVQTLPPWEIAAAEKVVSIAREQERAVGSRRRTMGGHPQKYFLSDSGRELILARYDSQTETIDWLAEQLSTPEHPVPRWQVRKWAKDLGVARLKEPPWSEAEVSFLRNSVRRSGLKKIAKALGRSETSVKIKAKRLGIRKLVTGDGYTMRAICRGLGVDHHQVQHWLTNGWFWGERRESRRHGRQRGDIWYFTAEAIQELVRQHPEEIDLRRVDRDFFIEVLLGPPQAIAERSAMPVPKMAARSAYAYLSDEAHSMLIAHYTGGLRRTEALAEVLGVTPDEVVTWAVLLGLEDASLHMHHVHQQEGRTRQRNTGADKGIDHHMSQSVRHLLETRFNGDPGATQALADDLGLSVEAVCALAQEAGIHSQVLLPDPGKDDGVVRAGRTKRKTADDGSRISQQRPSDDLIPLQAQVLIALHYGDAESEVGLLAEEITRVLATPISIDQVDRWAKRLGLRTRRKLRVTVDANAPASRPRRTSVAADRLAPLQLAQAEWHRFLSADVLHAFLPGDAEAALPTAEEIRLGYQVRLGAQERDKLPAEQDQSIIEMARQAEAHLATVLLPLVWTQALSRLGQGISLEALLMVGRCGVDEAIFQFDYADSHPLLSYALPAIEEEMELLIASTSASLTCTRHPKKLRLFARIADVSCRFAWSQDMAPTVDTLAAALQLSPDQVEKTIRFATEAWQEDEASGGDGGKGREKVSDIQFVAAFMKTQGRRSSEIIQELSQVLPLTPLTVQVKFYTLRLHTRIAERDRRRERAALRAEALRAAGPVSLARGHYLWDAVVDGRKQRWALPLPYGQLADTLSIGSQFVFEGHLYSTERVYYSTLVVGSVEAGAASQSGSI
jgi:DNA-directed RNA polymerase specialized sigma subunit